MAKAARSTASAFFVLLILCALGAHPLWAGKKNSEPRKDKDRAGIMQIVTKWVPALRSGEVERNLAFFNEDIVIAGPGSHELYAGPKAVRDLLTRILDGYKPEDGSIKVQTIQINGDWAELCAKFAMVWEPKKEGIKRVVESSNYVWLLKKQADDSWKIARFLFYPHK